jgi:hypothetical protein
MPAVVQRAAALALAILFTSAAAASPALAFALTAASAGAPIVSRLWPG